MTVPQEVVWTAEAHTLAKHEILRRYLGAWFPILGSAFSKVVYIDGFCGPGRYVGNEPGSPIIALQEAQRSLDRLARTQVQFLFVDEDPRRIAHLESELTTMTLPSTFKVAPRVSQFDVRLRCILDDLDKRGVRMAPTFAFIDPFGFKGVPFELIARLLRRPQTEVFINVMIDSINRFLNVPDDPTRQHIVDLFGTPQAIGVAQQRGDRISALRLLYQRQLQTCARFVRFFEMRNDDGRIIYYLFFATNHPQGHLKMKEAFWKVDPGSGFTFSDATNPGQPVLLQLEPTYEVGKLLACRFQGKTTEVRGILRFVEDETVYLDKHARAALKSMEVEKRIVVPVIKIGGQKRHGQSFPPDVIVQFS